MVLANLGENLKENQDFRLLRGIWGSPRFFPFFVLFVLDMRERERENAWACVLIFYTLSGCLKSNNCDRKSDSSTLVRLLKIVGVVVSFH